MTIESYRQNVPEGLHDRSQALRARLRSVCPYGTRPAVHPDGMDPSGLPTWRLNNFGSGAFFFGDEPFRREAH